MSTSNGKIVRENDFTTCVYYTLFWMTCKCNADEVIPERCPDRKDGKQCEHASQVVQTKKDTKTFLAECGWIAYETKQPDSVEPQPRMWWGSCKACRCKGPENKNGVLVKYDEPITDDYVKAWLEKFESAGFEKGTYFFELVTGWAAEWKKNPGEIVTRGG